MKLDSTFLKSVVYTPSLEHAEKLLRESEITNYAGFILLAVAISRRKEWLESESVAGLISASATLNEKLDDFVDALFVIFMFNMINVVANEFDIRPEWNTQGRFLLVRKRMMEFALPRIVKMTEIKTDGCVPVSLKKSSDELKLKGKEIWALFSQNPRIAIGIQQILHALSLTRNEAFGEQIDLSCKKSILEIFPIAVETSINKLSSDRLISHFDLFKLSANSRKMSCENKVEFGAPA